jgi:hypothetical protein
VQSRGLQRLYHKQTKRPNKTTTTKKQAKNKKPSQNKRKQETDQKSVVEAEGLENLGERRMEAREIFLENFEF